jgi:hypothetical protein
MKTASPCYSNFVVLFMRLGILRVERMRDGGREMREK